MRKSNAKVVQAALPIAVRFITERTGVPVHYGPYQTASTDLKSVYIPLLNDSEDARALGLGYALHESYHIKETDSLQTLAGLKGIKMDLTQILEDNRIEIRASMDYAGGNQVLKDLALVLMDKSGSVEVSNPSAALFSASYCYLEASRFTGQRFQERKEASWDNLRKVFAEIPTIPDRLEVLLSRADRLRSTKDARSLAEAIVSMIEEEKENLQQQSASSCQPNGGQSNDDQSNDGEPEDDQSNGGQSNDDQSNDGESDDGAGSNPTIKMLEDILDQDENNVGRDETIKQLIQENIDHTGSRQFYPATPYTIGQNARDDSVIAEAQGISSQMRRQLRQYLESSTWDEEFRTSNGRKLSSRALSSIPTGQTKVFTKRIDGVGIDTAVLFLIDRSGSMSNAIDTAAKAALAAALAIESNQGCSVQVAAFPGCKEDKVIEISKFGQKVADNSAIYRVIGTEGSTPLAPAMIYGLQELALRQEERKVMIVVTDGNPDCETSSERAYELAKKMGVDLIGIGINLDVDWLFKNSRKISSVDELPKCMFEVMKASMLTGNLHS